MANQNPNAEKKDEKLPTMYRIQVDTITLLLVEKGILTREEFFQKLAEVEADYRQKGLMD